MSVARFVDSDTGETGMDAVVVSEGFSLQLYARDPSDDEYRSIILSPEDANRLAVFLLQSQKNPANFVAKAGPN